MYLISYHSITRYSVIPANKYTIADAKNNGYIDTISYRHHYLIKLLKLKTF